jgi:hypothetical protein
MNCKKKMSAVSVKCIENNKLHSLSFDDIINDFALLKSQNQMF